MKAKKILDICTIALAAMALVAIAFPQVIAYQINATDSDGFGYVADYNATLHFNASNSVTLTGMWVDDFESYEANYYLERNTYIPQPSNVVAYYSFDGCNANDKTGVRNGTTSGVTCQRGLRGNNSYLYNGVSDYISHPAYTSNLSSFTIAAYATTSDTTAYDWVYGRSTVTHDQLGIQKNNAGKWRFFIRNNASTLYTADSTSSISTSTAYCLVGVYNSTHINLYVNGVNEKNTSATGVIVGNSDLFYIGREKGTQNPFPGTIDETLLVSTAWTQSEVSRYCTAANYTYRPQSSGSAYNVTSGIVSVGNYGAGSVGNRGLMCGLGGGVCRITKSISYAVTPTLSYDVPYGTANVTYSAGTLYINISDGGAIDNLKVYVDEAEVTSSSLLFCPATREHSGSVINYCTYSNQTNTVFDASEGLVAYYPFDEGWGATDATGRYNGTITGATTTAGMQGTGAYYFDGNDYISRTNLPEINNSNAFTMAAWIKTSTSAGAAMLVHDTAGTADRCGISTNAAGTIISVGCWDGTNWKGNKSYSIVSGRTLHVSFVYNGSNSLLYIDGAIPSPISGVTPQTTTAAGFTIGASSAGTSPAVAYVDDVRIYNRTLSADEIRSLYELGFPGAYYNASNLGTNVSNVTSYSTQVSTSYNYSRLLLDETPDSYTSGYSNAFDNNYSSFVGVPEGSGSAIYMNYTVPSGALSSSVWYAVDEYGSRNISLTSCSLSSPLQLRIWQTALDQSRYNCWNSTDWVQIHTDGASGFIFYDEAIYWNISGVNAITDESAVYRVRSPISHVWTGQTGLSSSQDVYNFLTYGLNVTARNYDTYTATVTPTYSVEQVSMDYQYIDNVANLSSPSQTKTSVYVTWTNPVTTRFNFSALYLDGVNVANTTGTSYNFTGLLDSTTYNVTIRTYDTDGRYNITPVSLINGTVVNNFPVVTRNFPSTAQTNLSENATYEFNITATDDDGGNLIVEWFKNGVSQLQETIVSGATSVWSWIVGYMDSGNYDITVNVTDEYNDTTTTTWNITIEDTYPVPSDPIAVEPVSGQYEYSIPLLCAIDYVPVAPYYFEFVYSKNSSNYTSMNTYSTTGYLQYDISTDTVGTNYSFGCRVLSPSGNSSYTYSGTFTKVNKNNFYLFEPNMQLSYQSMKPYNLGYVMEIDNTVNATLYAGFVDCNGEGVWDYTFDYSTVTTTRARETFACVNAAGEIDTTIGMVIYKNNSVSWDTIGCTGLSPSENYCAVYKTYVVSVT